MIQSSIINFSKMEFHNSMDVYSSEYNRILHLKKIYKYHNTFSDNKLDLIALKLRIKDILLSIFNLSSDEYLVRGTYEWYMTKLITLNRIHSSSDLKTYDKLFIYRKILKLRKYLFNEDLDLDITFYKMSKSNYINTHVLLNPKIYTSCNSRVNYQSAKITIMTIT